MIADLLIPLILAVCACAALRRRENVYDALTDGAAKGLRLLITILPSLIILLTAVNMLRASGISGSAALAVGADLMRQYGVDARIGRTAAVMLGSTETTFYTVSVYFSAAGISRTRYVIPAALLADLTGFAAAALFTRLFFG